jgi:hypothetical protein
MLVDTPKKPDGSTIEQLSEDQNELTFRWPLPSPGVIKYFLAAYLAFWVCVWVFVGCLVAYQLIIAGLPDIPRLFLIAWLGVWMVIGAGAARYIRGLLRSARPESVYLGMDEMRYDPGRIPMNPFPLGLYERIKLSELFTHKGKITHPVTVRRNNSTGFKLDQLERRKRLTFAHGVDRIEIGKHLRDQEREWLYTVLENWRRA